MLMVIVTYVVIVDLKSSYVKTKICVIDTILYIFLYKTCKFWT